MKNKIKKIFALIVVITIISFQMVVFADVGSFESYDSGSDWGSSSSSWDSDWSSSSSSWDWDDDYSYSGGSGSFGGGIGTIVIIVIIVIAIMARNNKGTPQTYQRPVVNNNYNNANIPQDRTIAVENEIKVNDELFNSEEFIAWTKDLFIKLQEAWMARDWSTIRFFETNELFEQHQKQLQGYIDNHQINMMERICVKNAYLTRFSQTGDKDILTVILSSKMVDYIINDETKEIIKGDKTTDRHSVYKMVFIRKTGVKTKEGESKVNTTNCPNCGAPTQITSAGKCDYCGSVITTGEFNWVLSNLEKIG